LLEKLDQGGQPFSSLSKLDGTALEKVRLKANFESVVEGIVQAFLTNPIFIERKVIGRLISRGIEGEGLRKMR
jgi:hypothetical protein